jgi:hypothetical protein
MCGCGSRTLSIKREDALALEPHCLHLPSRRHAAGNSNATAITKHLMDMLFLSLRVHSEPVRCGEDVSKEEMLHDRAFTKDFAPEHFSHAFVDLGPGLDAGDVVEHGTMPSQSDCFDAVDLRDAAEVHVLFGKVVDDFTYVNGLWADVRVM